MEWIEAADLYRSLTRELFRWNSSENLSLRQAILPAFPLSLGAQRFYWIDTGGAAGG